MQIDNKKSDILESHDNYEFKVLTNQHRAQALKVLAQGFAAGYPYPMAYYSQFPKSQQQKVKYEYDSYESSMSELIESGLSIGVFDTSNNNELVAIRMVKELNSAADQEYHEFLKEPGPDPYIILLEQQMLHQISNQYKALLQTKGQVLEYYGQVVKENHRGKKIYQKMVSLGSRLAKQKNFKYGFSNVGNKKSINVLTREGFQKIAQTDCTLFEHEGVKPFALMDQDNKMVSIWLKKF